MPKKKKKPMTPKQKLTAGGLSSLGGAGMVIQNSRSLKRVRQGMPKPTTPKRKSK